MDGVFERLPDGPQARLNAPAPDAKPLSAEVLEDSLESGGELGPVLGGDAGEGGFYHFATEVDGGGLEGFAFGGEREFGWSGRRWGGLRGGRSRRGPSAGRFG